MKRIFRYILVGVFAVFLGSSLTYMRLNLDNKSKSELPNTEDTNQPSVSKEDSIRFRSSERKEDTMLEQIYDITINGAKKKLQIDFSLEEQKDMFSIKGKFDDVNVFQYEGNKKEENTEEVFTSDFIKKAFNVDNFKFIKGLDGKNYLTILDYRNLQNTRNYYIFNQDLVPLNPGAPIEMLNASSTIALEGGAEIWYEDTLGICENSPCQIKAKIDKNKIYRLIPTRNEVPVEGEYGILQEYIVMPDRDRLITELISTYKIISTTP